MKNSRHEKILELIETTPINKQDDLLNRLQEAGFNVTQATVSRDIRELQLIKTLASDGNYRYVADNSNPYLNNPNRYENIFHEAVRRIDYVGNIVLVKCYSGMANAACEVFDSMVWDQVVGTLAGDDTFLVIMRDENESKKLVEKLKEYK